MMFADTIKQWDINLLLALNGSECAYLDGIMWTITHTSTWLLLFCAIFYLIIKNNDFRTSLLVFLLVALLITVADQVASGICKPLFQRLRPTHDPLVGSMIDIVNGYKGGRYGFFSSHASNTFAAATFFSLLFHKKSFTTILYIWAALCTYSRLYLGVHYPSDVIVGMVFGVLCGIVFYELYLFSIKVISRYKPLRGGKTGETKHDFPVLLFSFALTGVYILIRAKWYADSF